MLGVYLLFCVFNIKDIVNNGKNGYLVYLLFCVFNILFINWIADL